MPNIFIAQQRSGFEHSEEDPYTVISHHGSLSGAARAIADDARQQADFNAPGEITDDVHAAIMSAAIEDRMVDARDQWGGPTISSSARIWIDRHYRIEEVEVLA